MDGDDLGKTIADSVNSGIDPDALATVLREEHPHLQAEVVAQVLLPSLKAIAETPREDARNRTAVEQCQRLCETLADSGL